VAFNGEESHVCQPAGVLGVGVAFSLRGMGQGVDGKSEGESGSGAVLVGEKIVDGDETTGLEGSIGLEE